MAGQKLVFGETVSDGKICGGLPLVTIVENGNVEDGDEWALFRLTDDGLSFYKEGAEFRAGIMTMEGAVVKLPGHYKTEGEAIVARNQLSTGEKNRTLVRSVRPGKINKAKT